jgi:HPt (histidine-containing phosphotransfer) domain-containing protein
MDDYLKKQILLADLAAVVNLWTGLVRDIADAARLRAIGDHRIQRRVASVLDGDVIAGLRELDGIGNGMAEVVTTFVERTVTKLGELRRSIDDSDRPSLARTCHRLQGSSASLGATRMAELCTDLAKAGHTGEMVVAADVVSRLEAEFDRVREALTAEFPASR